MRVAHALQFSRRRLIFLVLAFPILLTMNWPAFAQQLDETPLAIVSPSDDETIFSNEGQVAVQLAVPPRLMPAPDEYLELMLDEHQVAQLPGSSSVSQFILTEVERGEHRLQARIVDNEGNTVAESMPVRFYMWHASRLFPSRR